MTHGRVLHRIIIPAAIIVAGFAAVICLSNCIEAQRPRVADEYVDTDLHFSGSRLKGFALGTEGLIADWYFMRSLQYIGDKLLKSDGFIDIMDLSSLNPRLLYPYLDNATDLDPHFIGAYTYGAIVLPAVDPAKAIAIAEKGVAHNPNEWRLYQYLGYIYWKLERYEDAANAYEKGSLIPDAPPFMKLMAGSVATEGGSRATARAIFRQMMEVSDDPMVKATAQRRLQSLDSIEEREAIDKALQSSRSIKGNCPSSLAEIIPILMKVGLPDGRDFSVDESGRLVDLSGVPYLLDRDLCRVKLDVEKTKLPIE